MLRGSMVRLVIIVGLMALATAALATAISMQDHFFTFVALLACLGLVAALFRGRQDDDAEKQQER